ncbi:hypothetical protein QE418_003429 [Microbacterium testaceum]|uniref:hypothetical protein n=1 Tax=Microbacterium testaceum TaxID=2033 RepID=UPI00278511B6|nr:hypothetical protein [Microbacterium testaceum]MDQ1113981.1 hypothetical protein [Microbacterium testaceum]
MPILNYTTTIAVEKTMGELIAHLTRPGVTRVSALYGENGSPTGVGFTMRTAYGLREFEIPVRTDGVFAALQQDPAVRPGQKTHAQAERVAWRIAQDWLEAQSALVDAQLATLDEVMLPYMVGPSGETMYAVFRAQQKEITQ